MLKWNIDRPDPVWVRTPEDISALQELLMEHHTVAIDTETTGLNTAKDEVIFWSLSTGKDRYFLERSYLAAFKDILEDPKRSWVGTHIKFDAHMLANSGINLRGDLFCTLVMDRLLDADHDHGLKESYEREFGEKMATFGEVFYPRNVKGKPYKPRNVSLQDVMLEAWESNREAVIDYASLDAFASMRLFKKLRKQLRAIKAWTGESLWDIYLRWEVPFTKVLFTCERNGVQIDTEYLESLRPKILREMEKNEAKLNRVAGEVVNPNSAPQLVKLFYQTKGLQPIAWTSGGSSGVRKPSVNVRVLEQHADEGIEEASIILRHRKLKKILSTYVEGILNKLDENGRLHTTLNQHVTDTGRLSSTEPNLQNIPRPFSDEFQIRKAFIPRPGFKFITADYDQLEMFLMAHWSRDEGMLNSIAEGRDLHSATAAMVWDEPYEDIVAAKKKDEKDLTARDRQLLEYRQFAKIVGFGLLYGKGAKLLAVELKIPEKVGPKAKRDLLRRRPDASDEDIERAIMARAKREGQKIIDKFFSRMKGAEAFIHSTHRSVADTKFVETAIGRRRWLRQVMDWEDQERHQRRAEDDGSNACWCADCAESRAGDRRSVNTIIQGSAADVAQAAMIQCHYDPQLADCFMLFQVHDELSFEVPEDYVEEASERIKFNMEHPGIPLRVPLKVSPGAGDNWIEAK